MTTTNCFLWLWVSCNDLVGNEQSTSVSSSNTSSGCTGPCRLDIPKIHNHWIKGARICLQQLLLTLRQDEEVVKTVLPYLESSMW